MTSTLLSARALVGGWTEPVSVPVDLTVAPGEIVGIAGPNGVGKSTFLATVTGGARIFSGKLEMAPGLRIAYQTQAMPPLEGLPLNGRELLDLTGAGGDGLPSWLAGRLGMRLDRLSGGQRQYLALWAILQAPADLLLLDEPTNNLDTAGCAHLAVTVKSRAAAGTGVVLVTHDAEFADAVCDRILALGAGHG